MLIQLLTIIVYLLKPFPWSDLLRYFLVHAQLWTYIRNTLLYFHNYLFILFHHIYLLNTVYSTYFIFIKYFYSITELSFIHNRVYEERIRNKKYKSTINENVYANDVIHSIWIFLLFHFSQKKQKKSRIWEKKYQHIRTNRAENGFSNELNIKFI